MFPRPRLTGPLDLMLHIGTGKTGTSSIQRFLHQNRAALADVGCLFPQSPGQFRHTRLGLFCRPDNDSRWDSNRWSSPAEFRRTFQRQLFREINDSGLSRVLLSDESLYGSPNEVLRRLRRFTDRIAGSLRLVVYLRRQDDHLVSRYQQVVKTGETRRLGGLEFDRHSAAQTAAWAGHQNAKTYDYYTRLQTWKRLLEPNELIVRRFEQQSFVEGSLVQDFLAAADIGTSLKYLNQVDSINESLDAEAVEFLRIINLFRRECVEATALPPLNRPLVRVLAANSHGPTLTMPAPALDEFMARWEKSNQRVAREILGDQTGLLFRTPRKTRNTTIEQHLDPGRLEVYLTLLELPTQMHAPLRRLVEREAQVR